MTAFGFILLDANTLNHTVTTSTDWPTVMITGLIGIGSIATSITVGMMSRQNQRIQNTAKTAELRQRWIEDLRENISGFSVTALHISMMQNQDFMYMNTPNYDQKMTKLLGFSTKVKLMLDAEKDYSLILDSLMKDVVRSITFRKIDETPIYAHHFTEQSQIVLEKAWNDIKRDLGTEEKET